MVIIVSVCILLLFIVRNYYCRAGVFQRLFPFQWNLTIPYSLRLIRFQVSYIPYFSFVFGARKTNPLGYGNWTCTELHCIYTCQYITRHNIAKVYLKLSVVKVNRQLSQHDNNNNNIKCTAYCMFECNLRSKTNIISR